MKNIKMQGKYYSMVAFVRPNSQTGRTNCDLMEHVKLYVLVMLYQSTFSLPALPVKLTGRREDGRESFSLKFQFST
jgi:hypothetical protein